MFATLTTTMACWANDVMTAIGANDRDKLWNLTTTLKFPKVTLYLAITTSAEVASGSTTTNIIHFAITSAALSS